MLGLLSAQVKPFELTCPACHVELHHEAYKLCQQEVAAAA